MCLCFLLESSFALDGAEFHGKRIQLLILQSRKGLPGYTLVLAKGIDAVPVRGVDTHLLHQLQASAALFLLVVTNTRNALHCITTSIVLRSGHLAQAVGTIPRPLSHEIALHPFTITTARHTVESCVKACKIVYFLCHINTICLVSTRR